MTIGVGLVGYGMAGSVFHAPLITSIADFNLTAIVSSRREQVWRDYPQVQVVATFEDLLERDDIALIVIVTPNATHYEFARKAIIAGKHVIVDKPFVLHVAQADELVTLAQHQRVVLSVFQNRRWDNDFLTVRQLLQNGILGEISSYEAHYDRYRPEVKKRWKEQAVAGSGTLYDLGPHLIDQALLLFGPPTTIWADVRAQRPGAQTDDYFHIVMNYAQCNVILHASSLVRDPFPHFQLHGSRGSFIKYGFDTQEEALKAGKRPGDIAWGSDDVASYGELAMEVGELTIKGKVTTLCGHYEAFYQEVAEAITQGKPVPVLPEEAREIIRVIECALLSREEQRVVTFHA